jgi:hypothetical protein
MTFLLLCLHREKHAGQEGGKASCPACFFCVVFSLLAKTEKRRREEKSGKI